MLIGSLFSGAGGLDLGVEDATGGRVVWFAESDPCARAVLARWWPGVRIYDDVREVDGGAARPDLVIGGFPCQPHSVAGRRRGTADARWLWPEFARVIASTRPRLVFIENVPGLRTSGLRDVLADLAALGFNAEWGCFSAADVGAPHIRRRLFLLAHADGSLLRLLPGGRGGEGGPPALEPELNRRGGTVADAHGEGELQQGGVVDSIGGRARHGGSSPLPHADGERLPGRPDDETAAGERRRDALEGDHAWAVEPDVGRVAHGVPARVDRLRLLGNACVPAQAAHAFRSLMARACA